MVMKLGLVCISEILKQKNKSLAFKTMTRKRFNSLDRQKSIVELSQRILHNCKLTRTIILHCSENNIKHYRISSNLFPLITDPTLNLNYQDLPDWKEIKNVLKSAGDCARTFSVSISSHPDQFNVLSSFNQTTVENTIAELNHQSYVLDLMGCPQDYRTPMCLHLNLSFDSKKESITEYVNRFGRNFNQCSEGVRQRLVLENEDGGYWNCKNLYESFGHLIPLVFDNLHNDVNKSSWTAQECFDKFHLTWGMFTPVMHWSEGLKDKPRSHADKFSTIPSVVSMNRHCVWECEVKHKDLAIKEILLQTV